MAAFELPEGWMREEFPHSKHCSVFHAPDGAGMVTVDFEHRLFRPGYSLTGPKASVKTYRGRAWRDELLADAVTYLAGILA